MSFRPSADQVTTVAGRGELIRLRDEVIPLVRPHRALDVRCAVEQPTDGLVIAIDDGGQRRGLLVDGLLGQQQVVIKPLGPYLGEVLGLAGATILGDGRVGLILSPIDLAILATRGEGTRPIASAGRSDPVEQPSRASPRAGKYLTFFLGAEEYGLDILAVQEIIALVPITRVPRVAPFVRGVFNLRGRVIPVIDLRLKFGMPAVEDTPETCIVVARAGHGDVGMVVDRVSDVVTLTEREIEPAPALDAAVDSSFLAGIGTGGGGVRLLLDVARVLSPPELESPPVAETPRVGGQV
jgi:chemotaxis signal transduction protein